MKRISFLTAFLCALVLSCADPETDDVPILSFQNGASLTCNLESPCFNPVKTSILKGIKLPDGTFIRQSGAITLYSSDESVAVPDGSGTVYLKKIGECTITAIQEAASGYNAKSKASYKLNVMPKLDDVPQLTWYQAQFRDISAPFYEGIGDSISNPIITSLPLGGPITYSSSNPSVATISSDGLIIAHSLGTATITGRQEAKEGVNQATVITCRVKVDPRPVISFEHESITCAVGDNQKYKNAWTSSIPNGGPLTLYYDTYLATINYQGEITDLKRPGTIMVTVVQEQKFSVNVRGQGSYKLTILPPILTLEFRYGTNYTCSTVNGGCINDVSNWELFDYKNNITYSSDDNTVATVNNQGVISPISTGVTYIRATQAEVPGKFQQSTGSYSIRVIDYPIPVLQLSDCGGSCTRWCKLDNSLGPCSTSVISTVPGGGSIIYTMADPTIATIDNATGAITPLKLGSTIVTAVQAEVVGVNAQSAPLVFGLLIY